MRRWRSSGGQESISRRRVVQGAVLAALLTMSVPVPAMAAGTVAERPAGWSYRSYYLAMPDGVELAVSLWFPKAMVAGSRHPAMLIQTRYGRAGLFLYGEGGRYARLLDEGYVVAVVDTRGSTSSAGDRLVELGPEEVRDMDSLITHLREQPWSDGQVFATGVSYMADTADLATASPAGLSGAVIRQSDFDAYLNLFMPGGISNDFMMELWGGDTLLRDYGRSLDPKAPLDCMARAADCAKLWPRLQPTDEDADFSRMRAAMTVRRHWKPDDYRAAEFRDDKGTNGYSMFSSSPASRLTAIARQKVPVQYWASWMDAGTADGTLARYRSLPGVPMEVWITANSHRGDHLSDPFRPDDATPRPGADAQWQMMTRFLADRRAGKPVSRAIHYYVLGAGTYRTTADWPPADVKRTLFHFAPGNSLSRDSVTSGGSDSYTVDATATTGQATRWTTQIGAPAAYGDRAAADARLLTYTSEPFEQDMELVGTPSVRLFLASRTGDPAFFAYLSDVAPDGRVTYLTEGLFRALHRKPAPPGGLPYAQSAPAVTYDRTDAAPLPPGQMVEVAFPTFPVAALIAKGHRLRVSLAGADAGTFRQHGAGDVWTIARTPAQPSSLSVDLRPWSAP